jgi:hypothetical protein
MVLTRLVLPEKLAEEPLTGEEQGQGVTDKSCPVQPWLVRPRRRCPAEGLLTPAGFFPSPAGL